WASWCGHGAPAGRRSSVEVAPRDSSVCDHTTPPAGGEGRVRCLPWYSARTATDAWAPAPPADARHTGAGSHRGCRQRLLPVSLQRGKDAGRTDAPVALLSHAQGTTARASRARRPRATAGVAGGLSRTGCGAYDDARTAMG